MTTEIQPGGDNVMRSVINQKKQKTPLLVAMVGYFKKCTFGKKKNQLSVLPIIRVGEEKKETSMWAHPTNCQVPSNTSLH